MKGEECPVCGKHMYFCTKGIYDREEWGQGVKITPDEYHCTYCGFRYSEDCRPEYSEEKMAKLYKEQLKERTNEQKKRIYEDNQANEEQKRELLSRLYRRMGGI